MKKSQLVHMVGILGVVLVVVGVVLLPDEGKKYLSPGSFLMYAGFLLMAVGLKIAYRRPFRKEEEKK